MTAWTAIVVLLWVMGKCALDVVGMEYGADAQHLTDEKFLAIGIGLLVFASIVDTVNFFRKRS